MCALGCDYHLLCYTFVLNIAKVWNFSSQDKPKAFVTNVKNKYCLKEKAFPSRPIVTIPWVNQSSIKESRGSSVPGESETGCWYCTWNPTKWWGKKARESWPSQRESQNKCMGQWHFRRCRFRDIGNAERTNEGHRTITNKSGGTGIQMAYGAEEDCWRDEEFLLRMTEILDKWTNMIAMQDRYRLFTGLKSTSLFLLYSFSSHVQSLLRSVFRSNSGTPRYVGIWLSWHIQCDTITSPYRDIRSLYVAVVSIAELKHLVAFAALEVVTHKRRGVEKPKLLSGHQGGEKKCMHTDFIS